MVEKVFGLVFCENFVCGVGEMSVGIIERIWAYVRVAIARLGRYGSQW